MAFLFNRLKGRKKSREAILKTVKKEKRKEALKAVKQDGYALCYVDDSLEKDREVVLEAVKQNGDALQFADDMLKKDKEIVLEAVEQSGWALQYADISLKKDKKIVLEAVKRCVDALRYAGYADASLKKDGRFMLEVMKKNGNALCYVDASLKKDREIVLEAVKQKGWALEHADISLKKDKEIVLEAVKQDGRALPYADDSLRKEVFELLKKQQSAVPSPVFEETEEQAKEKITKDIQTSKQKISKFLKPPVPTSPKKLFFNKDILYRDIQRCAKAQKQHKEIKKIDQDINSALKNSFIKHAENLSIKHTKLLKGSKVEPVKYFEDLLTKLRAQEEKQKEQGESNNLSSAKETSRKLKLLCNQQKQLSEQSSEQLKELEKLKKVVKNNPELSKRVKRLEKTQKLLYAEFKKRQIKLQQQQHIQKSPELFAFYNRVQLKLTELFLACKVINSGLVNRAENKTNNALSAIDNHVEKFGTGINVGIDIVGFFVSLIPGAGIVAPIATTVAKCITTGVTKGAKYGAKFSNKMYTKSEEVKINRLSHLTPSIVAMDEIAETFARNLAIRYEDQINCLTIEHEKKGIKNIPTKINLSCNKENGGAEDLAECAVGRVIIGLRSGNISPDKIAQKSLVDQMIDAVFYSRKKQGMLSLTAKTIETKSDNNQKKKKKKWTDQGIFKYSGIRTKDKNDKSVYFKNKDIKKPCGNPIKYGYRLGTKQEVKNLKLIKDKNPAALRKQKQSTLRRYKELSKSDRKQVKTVLKGTGALKDRQELHHKRTLIENKRTRKQLKTLKQQLEEQEEQRQAQAKAIKMLEEKMALILQLQKKPSQEKQSLPLDSSTMFFNQVNQGKNLHNEQNNNVQGQKHEMGL